jgi:hypothetical protein
VSATPAEHRTQARRPSIEQKFLFARRLLPLIKAHLKHVLQPDPVFSEGRISSVYYDTPSFDYYQEKRASEFLKTKIRLRWYGEPAASDSDVKCYLEVKEKEGSTRNKQRVAVDVPASVLADRELRAAPLAMIPQLLAASGHSFDGPLVPILIVQYERTRFLEPSTGARIAVDVDIQCPAVNTMFVRAHPPVFLDVCVLEVKSSDKELPHWMAAIRHYVRRDAFSKYTTCLERLLHPTGIRE